jgi:alkylhydroperoxidase/carboxymuconolactone decarboxylase family protein YurZ
MLGQHRAVAISGENLLRRLGANDEHSARMVLALRPEAADPGFDTGLTPRVRMLVRIAALVALDASTTCLRWAVELAACAGADDDEIVGVLLSVGPEVGLPRVISSAPRLAQAIGYEIGTDGADAADEEDHIPSRPALRARATASERDAASSLR